MKKAPRYTFLLTARGWDFRNENSFLIHRQTYPTRKAANKVAKTINDLFQKYDPFVTIQAVPPVN